MIQVVAGTTLLQFQSINKFITRVQYGVYKASIKLTTPPKNKNW